MNPLEPPEGCQEIHGYILTIKGGAGWLMQDGTPTDSFKQRGIWTTPEGAQDALDYFFGD